MLLSDEERWNAVKNCDERYDGVFYYAVKTTGIFCRPSCKSRTPAQKNVCFFSTKEDAAAAGFRPCKRCRPDLINYQPITELAQQAKNLIDTCFAQRDRLTEKMKQLGVSPSHLAVIFRQQYGVPPIEYLKQIRAESAKKLLEETAMPIIDVAGSVGLNSLFAFYQFFKEQTGMTPKEYRTKSRGSQE